MEILAIKPGYGHLTGLLYLKTCLYVVTLALEECGSPSNHLITAIVLSTYVPPETFIEGLELVKAYTNCLGLNFGSRAGFLITRYSQCRLLF